MRKQFSVLVVSLVIAGLVLSLVGMALVSQAASTEKTQNFERQTPKPIPATNVKVVKKIPLPLGAGGTKGKPAPQLGAATGVLGELATGTKYAVVIGICDYPGTNYDICKSDGDSYNMAETLVKNYGYKNENIYWYRDMGGSTTTPSGASVDGAPTWKKIADAVTAIERMATTGDEVVFFFSGHGARGEAADGDDELTDEAIVIHNDDSSGLAYIWDGELRSWFDGFGTTRIIFVFDTCLAGGQNDVAADGRVVAMATGETQSAYVYSTGELGEGVFSRYFVNEGMLQGLADGYNQLKATDGNVVVEEAFDYAKTEIPLHHPYLKQRQKPVISDDFAYDLLL